MLKKFDLNKRIKNLKNKPTKKPNQIQQDKQNNDKTPKPKKATQTNKKPSTKPKEKKTTKQHNNSDKKEQHPTPLPSTFKEHTVLAQLQNLQFVKENGIWNILSM